MNERKKEAREADIIIENLCGIRRMSAVAVFFMSAAKYQREVRLKYLRLSPTDKNKVSKACKVAVKNLDKNKSSGAKIARKGKGE